MDKKKTVLLLLLGTVAISLSPLAVKMVSFTPTASAFYRSFYAAVFLLLWSLAWYRTQLIFKNLGWLMPCIIAGVALGVDLIFWHKSILYLGAGPATFLGNSQVLFVAIYSALVFREKISKRFIVFAVVICTGLFMLLPESINTVTRPVGYLYGMIVGATYAIMLLGIRYAKERSSQDYPEILSLGVIFAFSALTIMLYAVTSEKTSLLVPDIRSHLYMAGIALIAQTIGWYFIKTNITRIPAHEGSLILIAQPILATIWGSLLFGEPIGVAQIIGLILAAGGLLLFSGKAGSKSPAQTFDDDVSTVTADAVGNL